MYIRICTIFLPIKVSDDHLANLNEVYGCDLNAEHLVAPDGNTSPLHLISDRLGQLMRQNGDIQVNYLSIFPFIFLYIFLYLYVSMSIYLSKWLTSERLNQLTIQVNYLSIFLSFYINFSIYLSIPIYLSKKLTSDCLSQPIYLM